jgi:hypothetical protein
MRRILILAALTAACRSSGNLPAPPPTVDHTRVETPRGTIQLTSIRDGDVAVQYIAAPPAAAWRSLVAAYGALGIPLTGVDSARLTLGTSGSNFRRMLGDERLSAFAECGTSAFGMKNADSYTVRIASVSALQSTANGTASLLRTQVSIVAAAEGTSETRVRCGSTGRLERRIAELVASAK